MKKEIIPAADSKKNPYAKPLAKMIELSGAGIICTSGENAPFRLGRQGYEEEDW